VRKFRIFSFLSLALILCVGCSNQPKSIQNTTLNLDSLLTRYPDSVGLLIKRGKRNFEQQEFDMAQADAAKAFRLDSNNLDARELFADIINNRPDRKLTTDVSAAQRHYKFVLKKRPKSPKVMVSLASTYAQQMDFDEAFKWINKALRLDKRYRDAYVLKGSIYWFLNKPDLAKSSYETAIQQDPKFFEAYVRLGALYQADSDPICIEYYRTAVSLKPKDPEILFSLAYAYQVFSQPSKALGVYRRMLRTDPKYYQALNQIGVIKQYNFNEIDSAIYYYNSAIQSEPRFVEAWHNLGSCYEEQGDITSALKAYSKALKYDPQFKLSRERADKLKNEL
jgi:tetratricopeptide (TPR) repeat protein